ADPARARCRWIAGLVDAVDRSVIRGGKLTLGQDARPLGRVGDDMHQTIEEFVELARRLEIHGLSQIVLRAVVTNLVPLAIAPLGLRAWIVPEDEADCRHALHQEWILIGAIEQVSLGLGVGPDLYVQ